MPDAHGLTSMSGERYRLRSGRYAAEVVQTGATLRVLTIDDRDLILPFGLDEVRPHMRGAVMVPWPGRIEDGQYTFDGEDHQLPLTEPASATAIHGLLCWASFTAVEQADDHVRLVALLMPQAGYPFGLRCEITYTLSDRGLDVLVAATNVGDRPAPYGAANHLYLVPGGGRVDDWTLTLDAGSYLTSPTPRFLPEGPFDVEGSDADFRTGRSIGSQELNHSFTRLGTDEAGWAEARVSCSRRQGRIAALRLGRSVAAGVQLRPPYRCIPNRPGGRADDLSAGRVQLRRRPGDARPRRQARILDERCRLRSIDGTVTEPHG